MKARVDSMTHDSNPKERSDEDPCEVVELSSESKAEGLGTALIVDKKAAQKVLPQHSLRFRDLSMARRLVFHDRSSSIQGSLALHNAAPTVLSMTSYVLPVSKVEYLMRDRQHPTSTHIAPTTQLKPALSIET